MRILILGGTTEARELACLIATDTRFRPVLSLAGRTHAPAPQPLPCRIGGFGGAEGLASWLTVERIVAIVDATHPFASQISANAAAASERLGLPLGSIVRPPWQPGARDRWTVVATAAAAARALGETPRRVFLTVGRLELSRFSAAPQHVYLARTIDPPADIPLPPSIRVLFERGPFDAEAEARLMRREEIEVLVSKNAGGAATYGKIEAARRLGLPVIMIERPQKVRGHVLSGAEAALKWLEGLHADHAGSRSARGV